MHVFSSVIAWLNALVLTLRILWPAISLQSFPLPGYQNIVLGAPFTIITFVAFLFAVWISLYWNHVRKHQWLFVLGSSVCFLWAALFISVSVGFGFVILGLLIRSK